MSAPIRTQPSFGSHSPNDIYIDTHQSPITPCGPPVILGPIVPSTLWHQGVSAQPTFMTCHMCNQKIKTVIFHRPTVKTHLVAACLCIFGFWPCMCVPYCMHTCNKTDHYCPYCSAFMGSYTMD